MVLLASKEFFGGIKPLNTYKGLAADFSTVMWNVPNPSFSYSEVPVIVAHLAKCKWVHCALRFVPPITWESRLGLLAVSGLGTGGQSRVSRQLCLGRVLCLHKKGSEKRLQSAWGLFILGQGGLPCSIKIHQNLEPLKCFGKACLRLKWVTPLPFVQNPYLTSLHMLMAGGKCCNKFALMMIKWFFPSLTP